jgi:hypothetical protein
MWRHWWRRRRRSDKWKIGMHVQAARHIFTYIGLQDNW